MRSRARLLSAGRWAGVAAGLLAAVAYLEHEARLWDYSTDAGPALDALAAGKLQQFFALQPLMGAVSVLVRLPLVLAAAGGGAGELVRYRLGLLPCAGAPIAVGIWLVRTRQLRPLEALPVALLAALTPGSWAAVRWGHPEELLGGALCVAALLLAPRRTVWAGVVLGLAVATKQWAVLAVAPVVLVTPVGRRCRLLACAIGVAELFTLPLFLGNTASFTHIGNLAATSAPTSTPESVWFLTTHVRQAFSADGLSATFYDIPSVVTRFSHPLIVLSSPLLALLAWRRRGDALALLALVLLLRCVLDPVDNVYYHAPFLLALLAWEVLRVRTFPVLTMLACLGLAAPFFVPGGPYLMNALYLAWTLVVGARLLAAAASVGPAARPFTLRRSDAAEPLSVSGGTAW